MNFESLVSHIGVIQHTLQAQASHAVNLALTARNWLIGYYIVEFEQNGEDRAVYGEQLLKKQELRLNTKGLAERRFREFRRLYQVYLRLQESVKQYIMANVGIRWLATVKSSDTITLLSTVPCNSLEYWKMPADRLFIRLSSTHLTKISEKDNLWNLPSEEEMKNFISNEMDMQYWPEKDQTKNGTVCQN